MILTDKLKCLLLRALQGSGKPKRIFTYNCRYSDIADWLEILEEEKLMENIIINNYPDPDITEKLVLTKLGRQELGRLLRKLNKK